MMYNIYMLSQRKMRQARREADICNSVIKRNKFKDAYVSFIRCMSCGIDAWISYKLGEKLPNSYEQDFAKSVSDRHDRDFRERQDAQRKKEQKNERKI